jgi:DNA-binding NtrC family response regulator
MRAGAFRPDLYYRLSAFPIEAPPLRERKEDIPDLVSHFTAVSATKHGKTIRNIEQRGMELLRSYDWPGNIRQLRNVIERSVITSTTDLLVVDEKLVSTTASEGNAPLGSFDREMEHHGRVLIERALTASRGRISGSSGAAIILQLPPTTLSAKIQALKIDVSKFRVP